MIPINDRLVAEVKILWGGRQASEVSHGSTAAFPGGRRTPATPFRSGLGYSSIRSASSFAKSNPTAYSVGYAFGGDQSAKDAGVVLHGGTPLATNQTVVRPVLTGDANLDGKIIHAFLNRQVLKAEKLRATSFSHGSSSCGESPRLTSVRL